MPPVTAAAHGNRTVSRPGIHIRPRKHGKAATDNATTKRRRDRHNRREKRKASTADQSQTASDLSVITVVISMPSPHTDSGIQKVPMNCPEYPDCFSL